MCHIYSKLILTPLSLHRFFLCEYKRKNLFFFCVLPSFSWSSWSPCNFIFFSIRWPLLLHLLLSCLHVGSNPYTLHERRIQPEEGASNWIWNDGVLSISALLHISVSTAQTRSLMPAWSAHPIGSAWLCALFLWGLARPGAQLIASEGVWPMLSLHHIAIMHQHLQHTASKYQNLLHIWSCSCGVQPLNLTPPWSPAKASVFAGLQGYRGSCSHCCCHC